jgi:outer membrane receptor protein involved in Fe transport
VTDIPIPAPSGGGVLAPGTRLPGTPKFQWSNIVSYEHALPFFTRWHLGPVLTHAFTGQATDALEQTGTIGGYHTLDARIAATRPDSRYLPEISLGVNNLTNVRGAAFRNHGNVIPSGTFDLVHFNTPRTVILSAAMRY